MMETLAQIKPQQPATAVTSVLTTYAQRLGTDVYEPMMRELTALEANLTGSELTAVHELKATVQELFAATAERIRNLR